MLNEGLTKKIEKKQRQHTTVSKDFAPYSGLAARKSDIHKALWDIWQRMVYTLERTYLKTHKASRQFL